VYRNCIFCSYDLGGNDVIEAFPVGRSLAFDSRKGRLWVVCPLCHRWNLAPIEERWEAVETAEKRFGAARDRAHAENIGIAHVADDVRLIRVGDALPGELAVWRYGRTLLSRRWKHWLSTLGGAALGVPGWSGYYMRRRVLARGVADGEAFVIRGKHLRRMEFDLSAGSVVAAGMTRTTLFRRRSRLDIEGAVARGLLERSLVGVNQRGGTRQDIDRAIGSLARSGDDDAHEPWPREWAGNARVKLRIAERLRSGFWFVDVVEPVALRVERHQLLALEMGLHEQYERVALTGELRALHARWLEAEEIASIADSL
jgi:hypothetical protein